MLSSTRRQATRAVYLASLLLMSSGSRALAQDSPSGEPSFKPTPSSAPAAKDTSNKLLGVIERLPESAYPSTPIRGLYGGSLWMTFHGLQWPYYPKTGIGVSGYTWVDTGYESLRIGNTASHSVKYLVQQGRLLLRATPTWSDGSWFVQGQAEIVANKDQSVAPPLTVEADDMWIKVGKWGVFDVQAGRYEAWEIYHFGMGMDLYTLERQGASDPNGGDAAQVYGVTYAFYRPANIGEVAVHLYPTQFLRFELGSQVGNESGQNAYAARPVGVLDFGWMKLKAGAEYKDLKPQQEGFKAETKQWGYGASLQFIVDPIVEFGLNGARGFQDFTDSQGVHNDTQSNATYSVGAFANARIVEDLLVGGGINYTFTEDQQFDTRLGRFEDFDHWQAFGAIQYLLWKQLYLKAVFGYALANINHNNGGLVYNNEMLSGRLRLLFLF